MKEQDVFPNRRSRTAYEQISIILESCKESQSLLDLFYILRSPYPQIRNILKEVIRLKLLYETGKGYLITSKGTEYLQFWEGFLKFLKESS